MDGRLVLLCHHGGWDRLYQAASAAATATSMGQRVDVVFFFAALERLVSGRLDELTCEPRDEAREARLQANAERAGTPPVSGLFAAARATGEARFWACSASIALTGVGPAAVREHVDEIVGWPTVLRLIGQAQHVLYL